MQSVNLLASFCKPEVNAKSIHHLDSVKSSNSSWASGIPCSLSLVRQKTAAFQENWINLCTLASILQVSWNWAGALNITDAGGGKRRLTCHSKKKSPMSVRLSVKAVACTSNLQSVYADRGGVILVFYFILKASISSLVLKKSWKVMTPCWVLHGAG